MSDNIKLVSLVKQIGKVNMTHSVFLLLLSVVDLMSYAAANPYSNDWIY